MDKKGSNFTFSSEDLSVVVLSPQPRFRAEWVYAFRDPGMGVTDLPPAARLVLFDVMNVAGVSPDGLLCTPVRRLLGLGVGRATRYVMIKLLQERGFLARGSDGLVYLSPELAYRGRASRWSAAWERWQALQKNAASGKAEDDQF